MGYGNNLSGIMKFLTMILIVGVIAFAANRINAATSRKAIAGIPEPVQTKTTGNQSFHVDDYDVNMDYTYSYDISGLVVSSQIYSGNGVENALSPMDVALAWGKVAEYNDRINFHWDQSSRWYHWFTDGNTSLDPVGGQDGVNTQSSNNHLIPADDSVKEEIDKIKSGDYIKISGYLVNIKAFKSDGAVITWNSSTSRTDTGDHSCELIYVTSIEWLN